NSFGLVVREYGGSAHDTNLVGSVVRDTGSSAHDTNSFGLVVREYGGSAHDTNRFGRNLRVATADGAEAHRSRAEKRSEARAREGRHWLSDDR
ncbi:MAG: hypothetical protein MJZ07_05640, partial [Bacteroidales bacterium]|nr:hypothetical protein [Bacteroidales bacterium]